MWAGVGDAFGEPVEFMSGREILARFGPEGVAGYGGVGRITDDTQMTLFTAKGLIRAHNRFSDRGISNVPAVVHWAYQRWLFTHEGDAGAVPWDPEFPAGPSAWLAEQPVLRHRRAPGTTCLASLHSVEAGTVEHRRNDSKGCGASCGSQRSGCCRPMLSTSPATSRPSPMGTLRDSSRRVPLPSWWRKLMAGKSLHRCVLEARHKVSGHPDGEEVTAAIGRGLGRGCR